MRCGATVEKHCCYLPGEIEPCEWFNPTLKGGFCSLMAELGDWSLVYDDVRYERQKEAFTAFGSPLCGDYPRVGSTCGTCGADDSA